jgi:NAD(P)-dependent dehydrogenase (short-subunit alcohol dehydrogenase family)
MEVRGVVSTEPKVIIVTGGASGIGYTFAQNLAYAGHKVVIADLNGAAEAASRLRAQGLLSIGVEADVASESGTAAMVNMACNEFDGVDVLVNNAGIYTTLKKKPFDQITSEEWRRVMDVNVLGPFNCAKAVVPHMRQRGGGRIINIASTAPIKGSPNMVHYVASKGAVIAFTRSLARELGIDGITVNAIAPGFTLSEGVLRNGMHDSVKDSARKAERSIKRDQVPQDLVGALVFLISDGAGFITGQTIAVEGGAVFL